MKDFFSFRLMITAGLIKVIYPLGMLIILALAGFSWFGGIHPKDGTLSWAPLMSWEQTLIFFMVGNVFWRIFCEQMILLFSIHESLQRARITDDKR